MNLILKFLLWWGSHRPYFDIIGNDGSLYMGRWWLFGGSNRARDDRPDTGWHRGRVDAWIGRFVAGRLHLIAREDRTRDFHTHPASFISIVIAGWYRERRPLHQAQDYVHDTRRFVDTIRRPGSIAFRRWSDRHTITQVSPGGAWTFVIWFGKRGSWGFATKKGFINWRRYEMQP